MVLVEAQFLRFVLVGLIALIVDVAVFMALVELTVGISASNIFARLSGTICGFFLHGSFTFGAPGASVLGIPRFWRYLALWGFLTAISSISLVFFADAFGRDSLAIVKPAVELALALASYAFMRALVFKK